jgi:hypothetical protein
MVIKTDQMRAFRDAAMDSYVARVAEELRQQFRAKLKDTSDDELRARVRVAVDAAKSYGVTSAVDGKRFAEYTVEYGPDFDRGPWAYPILTDATTGSEKMDALDAYTTFELRN